jgi:hypothetical protein
VGRFIKPDNSSPKNQAHQEIRDDHQSEVPAEVPSLSEAVSGPQIPPDLARVVAAWDRLPEAIKAGVLALVQAAGGSNA